MKNVVMCPVITPFFNQPNFMHLIYQCRTQGGPSGKAHRAMDMHAHDAVRYIGDMLAWTHQAVASEEEFLESIFGEGASAEASRLQTKLQQSSDQGVSCNLLSCLCIYHIMAICIRNSEYNVISSVFLGNFRCLHVITFSSILQYTIRIYQRELQM